MTPLYSQKLTLTSPAGGGRSVGIVRSRTKATEFSFSFIFSVFMYAVEFLDTTFADGLPNRNTCGARGGAVSLGIAQQAGRSRVRIFH